MIERKMVKFFRMGAIIFIATALIDKSGNDRLMIAGLIFAGIALLCANIGNIRTSREKNKSRLRTPKKNL